MLPAPVKSGLKASWAGVVTVACKCLCDEAKAQAKFLPAGVPLDAFLKKVEDVTKKSAIEGFNHLVDKARRTRRTGVLGSMVGGIHALGTGIINVGNVSADIAKKAGSLTGGALTAVLKTALCPSTVLLIKAAAAAIGIPKVPACAVTPVSDACKTMIDKVVGKRTLLRRLNSLKRELQNF
jgi:hypothetical protein